MKKTLMGAALAVLCTGSAMAQTPALPKFRLCTGDVSKTYYWVGTQVALQAKGAVDVQVVETRGSMDNLARIDANQCDGAIVQSDASAVFQAQNPRSTLTLERGAALYKEYVHLFCNPSYGIGKITDLTEKTTVLIGPNGSGDAVTWAAFVMADKPRYGKVPTQPIGGMRALSKVQGGEDAACMFTVMGLSSQFGKDADTLASNSSGKLALAKTNDGDVLKLTDGRKHLVYGDDSIPGGTYPKGFQTGWGGTSVATVSVTATFVANTAFIDADEGTYNKVLRAVNASLPAIKQRTGS